MRDFLRFFHEIVSFILFL